MPGARGKNRAGHLLIGAEQHPPWRKAVSVSTPYSESRTGNGLAIAALVCGVVGIFLFNIILGPLAIIFGGVGLSRANRGAPYRGMSIAGIALGIVDLVLFVALLAAVKAHGGYWHVG
jgi:hypothetical protein